MPEIPFSELYRLKVKNRLTLKKVRFPTAILAKNEIASWVELEHIRLGEFFIARKTLDGY